MTQIVLTAFCLCLAGLAYAQHTKVDFKALKSTQTGTINLKGSFEEVFPLFDPINETKWIPEWKIEIIYQKNEGKVEEGMVFRTDKGESERLWTILKFDEINRQIQYLYVLPDKVLVKIDLAFTEIRKKQVEAQITYSLTALSEAGNKLASDLTSEVMDDRMSDWEKAVNTYLLSTN